MLVLVSDSVDAVDTPNSFVAVTVSLAPWAGGRSFQLTVPEVASADGYEYAVLVPPLLKFNITVYFVIGEPPSDVGLPIVTFILTQSDHV